MTYKKGDLILSSDGESTTTCVILTEMYHGSPNNNSQYYYGYCLETGLYRLLYESEIVTLLCEEFAVDFNFQEDLFDINWSFYDYYYEAFSYFPSFFSSGSLDFD